jgi:hypothetical protein
MTYIPGFEHDIFISYARLNNKPWGNQPGWVDEFYVALDTILKENLTRTKILNPNDLNIWLDTREIEGNENWDTVIEKAVRGSAVMISILSDRYLESPNCLQELEEFSKHSNIQVEISGKSSNRVFKVLIDDIPNRSHPQNIVLNNGYKFFTSNPLVKEPKRLRQNNGEYPDPNYQNLINNLAIQLAKVLEEMLKKPEDHSKNDAPIVYLAEVSDDLADERDAIKNTLAQRGVIVLPTYGLSNSSHDIQKIIRDDMERAAFYIHPLGQYYKRVSQDNNDSLSKIQHETAAEVGKQKNLERLVWIKPDFEISKTQNQTHREFLESLVSSREPNSPMEVIREESIEKLKDLIIKRVFPNPIIKKLSLEKSSLIYISHLPDDSDDANKIKTYLKNESYDVSQSLNSSDEQKRKKDHKAQLKVCDAVLVLYGKEDGLETIRDRMIEARNASRRREKNPIKAKSLCDGPPDPKPPIGMSFNDWIEIECRNGIDAVHFENFFEVLKNSERR